MVVDVASLGPKMAVTPRLSPVAPYVHGFVLLGAIAHVPVMSLGIVHSRNLELLCPAAVRVPPEWAPTVTVQVATQVPERELPSSAMPVHATLPPRPAIVIVKLVPAVDDELV